MAEHTFGSFPTPAFEGSFAQPLIGGQSFPFGNGLENTSGGAVFSFRMRGFDQDGGVNDYVYWDATIVDALAAQYTGPGPVVDIVLQKKLGT